MTKTISYILQLINSARFMTSSWSNLANSFAEEIHKIRVKMNITIKNVKCVKLNTKIATAFLNT